MTSSRTGFWILALLVILGNWLLIQTPIYGLTRPLPEWPIAFDLLVMLPLLYIFIHRKVRKKALLGGISLIAFGILVGAIIIPSEHQQIWTHFISWRYVLLAFLVLAELTLITFVIYALLSKRRSSINTLESQDEYQCQTESRLHQLICSTFGPSITTRFILLEMRMWLYCFGGKRRLQITADKQAYYYDKQYENASTQQGFLFLIGAELPIAHVLIHLYSPTLALVITALSVYGFCFLVAEYRATLYRPISISHDVLHLKYGLLTNTKIPLNQIASVQPAKQGVKAQKGRWRFKGSGDVNVCIQMKPHSILQGLFRQEHVEEIYLGVNNPQHFIQELNCAAGA